jgi:hypothetical protein
MEVSSIFARYKIKLNDNKVYDPIRQIYVKATPEEIVRQKTIKFLQLRLNNEIPNCCTIAACR